MPFEEGVLHQQKKLSKECGKRNGKLFFENLTFREVGWVYL